MESSKDENLNWSWGTPLLNQLTGRQLFDALLLMRGHVPLCTNWVTHLQNRTVMFKGLVWVIANLGVCFGRCSPPKTMNSNEKFGVLKERNYTDHSLFFSRTCSSRATYLLNAVSVGMCVCVSVCMYVCMFVDSYNLISNIHTRWLT